MEFDNDNDTDDDEISTSKPIRRENWVFVPVVVIILILLTYSIFSVYLSTPSRPQLSVYSDNWGDLSDCREAIRAQGHKVSSIISTPTILSKLNESKNKIYVAVGIERAYSPDDTRAIWEFMKNGGNVIIADDFGHGNSLWENPYGGIDRDHRVIKDIEFKHQRLYDLNYIKNTKFVSVNASFLGHNYQLVLNEPSVLDTKGEYFSSGKRVLATSSPDSWLDENENGIRDTTEPKKEYDIIAYNYDSEYKSIAIVVSDPGLFINDNWALKDNSEFIINLINFILPNGGEVIFDESRHINENSFENSRHMLYSGIVYLTSSIWSIIILAIIIIAGTMVVGGKIKPQFHWRNDSLLNLKYLNILNQPRITSNDYWEIYSSFLEKVRLSYGFAPEEFRNLDRDTLFKLVNNRALWNFITQQIPLYPDNEYYRYITRLVIKWSPSSPDEFEDKYEDEPEDEPEGDEEYEFEVIDDNTGAYENREFTGYDDPNQYYDGYRRY